MLTVKKLKSKLPYGSNCYYLSSSSESVVIDPSSPPENDFDYSGLRYVLLTHSHFDHILEIDEWKALGAEVLIAQEEIEYLCSAEKNCYKVFFGIDKGYFGPARGLSDGETISFGDEEIIFRRTPGHTPGSGMYFCKDFVFVGDTVFDGGGYGRWDLPGGNYSELKESIDFVLGLEDNLTLFPGHGSHTTVRELKRDYRR